VEPLVGGATPDDDGMAFTTAVVDVVGRSNEAMIARDIIDAVTIMPGTSVVLARLQTLVISNFGLATHSYTPCPKIANYSIDK